MTHSGEKHFACSDCGYTSTHLRARKIHKALHRGQQIFKCNQCDFSGARKDSIKSHNRTDSRVKSFS